MSMTFISVSGQQKLATNTNTQTLIAAQLVNKAYQTGDTLAIKSVIAPDFIDHTERGDIGLDKFTKMIAYVRKAYPDMKTEIIKEFADEDYVFSLLHFTGTSKGNAGTPDGNYDLHTIEVYKFENGKIIEHWAYTQMKEVMKLKSGTKQ
jgi:predicted SnoaL-like aldol condensation-catalyzing enzyme